MRKSAGFFSLEKILTVTIPWLLYTIRVFIAPQASVESPEHATTWQDDVVMGVEITVVVDLQKHIVPSTIADCL